MSVRTVTIGFLDPRRLWLRLAAGFGVAALCLNLLLPLAVASAAPADDDVMCSAVAAGGRAGRTVPPASSSPACHCPLCLILAGGAFAPSAGSPAALPPPFVHIQPRRPASTLPPAVVRLIAPYPRAPPVA